MDLEEIDEDELLNIDDLNKTQNPTNKQDNYTNNEPNSNTTIDNNLYDMTDLNNSILFESDMQSNSTLEHTSNDEQTSTTHNTNEHQNNNETNTLTATFNEQTQTRNNTTNITKPNNTDSVNDGALTNNRNGNELNSPDNEINRNDDGHEPRPETDTSDININNLPTHLLIPFKILNTLKQKRDKQKINIDNLNQHKQNNTTPPTVTIRQKCRVDLPPALRERWDNTLTRTSNELLDILTEYHQMTLDDMEMKILHRTQHLRTITPDQQLADKIIKKLDEVGKTYTRRTVLTMIKSTKNLKRQQRQQRNQQQRQHNRRQRHQNFKQIQPHGQPQQQQQQNLQQDTTTQQQLYHNKRQITNNATTTQRQGNRHHYTNNTTIRHHYTNNNTTRHHNNTHRQTNIVLPPTPLMNHNYAQRSQTLTQQPINIALQPAITQHIQQGIQDFLLNRHTHKPHH